MREHGTGYKSPTHLSPSVRQDADVAISFNQFSRRPGSPLGPFTNIFVIRGDDGVLRAVWSVHVCAYVFSGMDMFTITREPLSRLRSSLDYFFSGCASDAKIFSLTKAKWDLSNTPPSCDPETIRVFSARWPLLEFVISGVIPKLMKALSGAMQGRFLAYLYFPLMLVRKDLLFTPMSLWLDKGGGQGMVEKRYELATEHAKCLDDLAAWLKVPPPPAPIKGNVGAYNIVQPVSTWGAVKWRIAKLYANDFFPPYSQEASCA
mmetsp:Transcript_8350/g.24516  ORF Transcript_8350/g.24516 Transcript_8350/m.24516 type:complete len:262 (+) Transcript_8350:165-950(+)